MPIVLAPYVFTSQVYSQNHPIEVGSDAHRGCSKDAAPSRTWLVQGYMKIECPQCWVACHLYHDGMEMKVLRGYFLRASWQISDEHPDHSPAIDFEPSLVAAQA